MLHRHHRTHVTQVRFPAPAVSRPFLYLRRRCLVLLPLVVSAFPSPALNSSTRNATPHKNNFVNPYGIHYTHSSLSSLRSSRKRPCGVYSMRPLHQLLPLLLSHSTTELLSECALSLLPYDPQRYPERGIKRKRNNGQNWSSLTRLLWQHPHSLFPLSCTTDTLTHAATRVHATPTVPIWFWICFGSTKDEEPPHACCIVALTQRTHSHKRARAHCAWWYPRSQYSLQMLRMSTEIISVSHTHAANPAHHTRSTYIPCPCSYSASLQRCFRLKPTSSFQPHPYTHTCTNRISLTRCNP